MSSWKATTYASKPLVEAALAEYQRLLDIGEWDFENAVTGFEVAPDQPNDWRLDAYFPQKPSKAQQAALARLFSTTPPDFTIEKLPEEDWLTVSQQGVEPFAEGRFYVHTPDHSPSPDPQHRNFVIPASQAFGTGHHETTSGCLAILDAMKRSGLNPRNIADIGTGTGLLAFAAMELWPRAFATASDIDPVCEEVVEHNAALNSIALGSEESQLLYTTADGTDDPLIEARGPYDLLIANILAGPLIQLAPDFSRVVDSRGSLLLAGLLSEQEDPLRAAYRRERFRLAGRLVRGDWSILWLRKRPAH